MHDQRVEARPTLGGINARYRRAIIRARRQTVHRLRRHRDQSARAQHIRRCGNAGGVGQKDAAFAGHGARLYRGDSENGNQLMPYTAPTTEQRFVLDVIADLPGLAALPAYANATPDMVDAILAESGKLAGNVFAPLNKSGDKAHAKLDNGVVTLPAGFVEAYGQYVQAGWAGLGVPEAHGGQGLPFAVAVAEGPADFEVLGHVAQGSLVLALLAVRDAHAAVGQCPAPTGR